MLVNHNNTPTVGLRKIDKLKGRLKTIQSMKETEQSIEFGGNSIRKAFKNALAVNRVNTEMSAVDVDTRDDLHTGSLNLLDLDQLASSDYFFSERETRNIHDDTRDDESEDEVEIMLYNDLVQSPPKIKRHPTRRFPFSPWQATSENRFHARSESREEGVTLRSAFQEVSISSKPEHSIDERRRNTLIQNGERDRATESAKIKTESSLEKGRRLRNLGLNKKSCFKKKPSSLAL